jgi:hypothetical protein
MHWALTFKRLLHDRTRQWIGAMILVGYVDAVAKYASIPNANLADACQKCISAHIDVDSDADAGEHFTGLNTNYLNMQTFLNVCPSPNCQI